MIYSLSVEGSTDRGGIHRPWRGHPEGPQAPRGVPDTGGGSRHGRWIPTREGVNHLRQELRPQVFTLLNVSFCANEKAPPGGLRSHAQRDEARGFGGLPPF